MIFIIYARHTVKNIRLQSQLLFFVKILFFVQKELYLKKNVSKLCFKQTTDISVCPLCTVNRVLHTQGLCYENHRSSTITVIRIEFRIEFRISTKLSRQPVFGSKSKC